MTADGKYTFIFGGYDGTKCLNDLWLLDNGAMTMRQLEVEAPIPAPRSRHTMHIIGDVMHVFGGYDNSAPSPGDVFTLNVSDPGGMESFAMEGEKKEKEDKGKKEAAADDED